MFLKISAAAATFQLYKETVLAGKPIVEIYLGNVIVMIWIGHQDKWAPCSGKTCQRHQLPCQNYFCFDHERSHEPLQSNVSFAARHMPRFLSVNLIYHSPTRQTLNKYRIEQ